MRPSNIFEVPDCCALPVDSSFTAEEYEVNLSTQPGVEELPPDERVDLVERITRWVAAHGGTLTVKHLVVLAVATMLTR